MYLLKSAALFCAYAWGCYCYSLDILKGCHQLIVVTTQGWNENLGELSLYKREGKDSQWSVVQAFIPVVLGKNGLAWGIGLHPTDGKMNFKKEGDGKSPAGIFSLGSVFGFASSDEMSHLKMEYLPLHEFIEAVDDPFSSYYNCIVDKREVIPDWDTSEKMSQEPLYAIGVNVHHNFPNPKANAGSAIFFHIWRDKISGTGGCTAMSQADLNSILFWLDKRKNPTLVQLPLSEYLALQNKWKLPVLVDR